MDLLKQIECSVTNGRGFIDSDFHAGEEIDEMGLQERLLIMDYVSGKISPKKYERSAKEIQDLRVYVEDSFGSRAIRDVKTFDAAMTSFRRKQLSEARLTTLLEEEKRLHRLTRLASLPS